MLKQISLFYNKRATPGKLKRNQGFLNEKKLHSKAELVSLILDKIPARENCVRNGETVTRTRLEIVVTSQKKYCTRRRNIYIYIFRYNDNGE